jgi:hypothetical protein
MGACRRGRSDFGVKETRVTLLDRHPTRGGQARGLGASGGDKDGGDGGV